ncbi:MAG: cytochrome c biogenesis protein CcsA [Bacteroidales bacterium]|nr:cytochrome c biogenesis protein CcsA [Bacteroidales bacterium]
MKRWVVVSMVLTIIAMIVGTLLEKSFGSAFALTHVYRTPWFMALLIIVVALGCVVLWQHKLYRRLPTAGIHFAFVFIVAGIILTTFTAQSGRLTLAEGLSANTFQATDDGRSCDGTLPFDVKLQDFEVVNYPGTHAPQDFVTSILFVDPDGSTTEAQVSMNKIAQHRGYRFYQAGYDNEGHDFLTVAHDPWGIGFTYAGYLILALSFIGFFFDRQSNFRQLLRGPAAKASVVVLLLLAGTGTHAAAREQTPLPRTLPAEQAETLGRLYVLYNDRVCPLQTLATEFTTKLYGKASYRGLSAEQVLSGWIFYYSDWSQEPMFKIKGDAVRQTLGLSGRYASLNDFVDGDTYKLKAPIDSLDFSNPLRNKMLAADEKYNLIAMLYGGQLLKIFPLTDSLGALHWYSQSDQLPLTVADDEYLFIKKSLSYCQELVAFGRYDQLDTTLVKLRAYQQQRAGALLPPKGRIAAERLINSLNYSRLLAMFFITLGLICFVYTIVRMAQRRQLHAAVRILVTSLLALLAVYLCLMFVLRWIVSGHVPLSNGYETMLFLSLCVSLFALFMQRRHDIVLPAGLLLVGFTLLVAMIGGSNPSVTQLMPVLNSPLLCIHVAIIMISYSLLAFAMLNGIAGLVIGAVARQPLDEVQQALMRISQLLLYPAIFCLAIGIFIGAIWANVSWGTYWSWDPKEVWALITLLVYAFPLHVRSFPWLRKPKTFHLYMVLAFLTVLITYFGVNLILGGMHSYA